MDLGNGVIREKQRALEDYLKAIYKLEEMMGIAKTTMLARELGVTPATVAKMVAKLAREGLVEWEPYRGLRLSARGRAIAEKIIWKHRIAEYFFNKLLGFDMIKSHIYAHMLEHLPGEVFEKLYEVLGKPATCPHGNPIPGATPPPEVVEARPLTEFKPGSKVRITRIVCALERGVLETIAKLGISVGSELCIESIGAETVIVAIENQKLELRFPLNRALRGIAVGECVSP